MQRKTMTLPVGGSGCVGTFHISGNPEKVKEMMDKINQFVRNELHVQMVESRIPATAKPSPCAGCGN